MLEDVIGGECCKGEGALNLEERRFACGEEVEESGGVLLVTPKKVLDEGHDQLLKTTLDEHPLTLDVCGWKVIRIFEDNVDGFFDLFDLLEDTAMDDEAARNSRAKG
jgi:hypothetical protein